jgi:hypothetical protein
LPSSRGGPAVDPKVDTPYACSSARHKVTDTSDVQHGTEQRVEETTTYLSCELDLEDTVP